VLLSLFFILFCVPSAQTRVIRSGVSKSFGGWVLGRVWTEEPVMRVENGQNIIYAFAANETAFSPITLPLHSDSFEPITGELFGASPMSDRRREKGGQVGQRNAAKFFALIARFGPTFSVAFISRGQLNNSFSIARHLVSLLASVNRWIEGFVGWFSQFYSSRSAVAVLSASFDWSTPNIVEILGMYCSDDEPFILEWNQTLYF
jgi:hypothetical protein